MESFIEINEEIVLHFEDYVYDAILNRTIQEFEDDYMIDFVEFLNKAKREANGYLSLMELDAPSFIKVTRYMRRAFSKSQPRKTGLYSRKAHNLFLKEFKNLINILIREKRYQK